MKGKLNINRCLNEAVETYKQHWLMLVAIQLILGVMMLVTLGIIAGPLLAAYSLLLLRLLRKEKEKAEISDLFTFFHKFWPLLGLFFLQALILTGGFLLFVIPGIIFSVMLMYAFYLAADKGLAPLEAIKSSWKIVSLKGFGINFGIYALSVAITFVVQMIPVLGYILGIFVSPFAALLIASAYVQQVDEDQGDLAEIQKLPQTAQSS